ncbi:3-oxoacyl-ACP reductase family protein [Microbacterium sp. A94]|uniref:3-oxoacyl-ACP reductase family protein n=1 Tax=Microbacterium sp. A94 TaxID=3450717 RepID=UPI003F42A9FA
MANLTFNFSGRTVIVTGAARGIGLEVSRAFALAGADVVMADFDADVLTEAATDVGGIAVQADVSRTDDAERVIQTALEHTGRVDILINNAGILRDRMLWKLTDEDWESVLAVHAGGTFRFSRAVVPTMRAQGYGRIINVTSFTGLHGNLGQANYATAKAGIIGFTKTAAKELAGFGITVNAISPQAATRMTASIPEERIPELTGPIARFAAPAEIAGAIEFLAAEESGFITGAVLPVDGGISM